MAQLELLLGGLRILNALQRLAQSGLSEVWIQLQQRRVDFGGHSSLHATRPGSWVLGSLDLGSQGVHVVVLELLHHEPRVFRHVRDDIVVRHVVDISGLPILAN